MQYIYFKGQNIQLSFLNFILSIFIIYLCMLMYMDLLPRMHLDASIPIFFPVL